MGQNTLNHTPDENFLKKAETIPINRKRLLIFVVAYNAEKTIQSVLFRIPKNLQEEYHIEVLIIDDASKDKTFEQANAVSVSQKLPFLVHVLYNPTNQGYGGNQKIGYHFADKNQFDFVALLHGDGQYAPECLFDLVRPLAADHADAVFGSRMMVRKSALKGGMPLYKYIGNKILTSLENRMLKTKLSEFHSGYRAYSVKALRKIPWHLNTNDFHFDTEIIIQFVFAGLRLLEVPIPTYYGEEICHVNGIAYAVNVLRAVTRAKAQELSLFYDRRFDCVGREHGNAQYQLKLNYTSPHKLVIEQVASGSTVLDLGCAGGYVSNLLREKYKCVVTGLDNYPLGANVTLDEFIVHDLNTGLPDLPYEKFKYILLLDVIEHLISPEDFVDSLRNAVKFCPDVTIIASTANVGFFITRIMLLLGQYNYGKRGILDMTHSRLFFFRSFRRLFEQAGFEVVEEKGIPGPYPLALGENRISRFLVSMNNALIRISKRLFSYQIYLTLKPLPSLEYLLTKAFESSKTKSKELGEVKISLP